VIRKRSQLPIAESADLLLQAREAMGAGVDGIIGDFGGGEGERTKRVKYVVADVQGITSALRAQVRLALPWRSCPRQRETL
jgi:hypothetical protein